MWQQTPASSKTWAEARSYCNDLTHAGYSDWRVPTPKELLSIVDHSTFYPASVFSGYYNDFWTSKIYVTDPDKSWYVSGTSVKAENGTEKNSVRCVRGKKWRDATSDQFVFSTVGTDEIVTDTTTGLIWHESGSEYWKDALKQCENSTHAGFTDWRLPNINEVVSLINYNKAYPASNWDAPFYFDSSTTSSSSNRAANVDFRYGELGGEIKTSWRRQVLCVRSE